MVIMFVSFVIELTKSVPTYSTSELFVGHEHIAHLLGAHVDLCGVSGGSLGVL